MFVYMCHSMSTCGRVPRRSGLAARVWTLHALFIPLTSDKAEALLVMMWLLLPIMPRCRPHRKSARCILCVLQQLAVYCWTWLFWSSFFFYLDTDVGARLQGSALRCFSFKVVTSEQFYAGIYIFKYKRILSRLHFTCWKSLDLVLVFWSDSGWGILQRILLGPSDCIVEPLSCHHWY